MPEDTADKDIQRAYRRLARKYHPDANPEDLRADDRFKELSVAYDVLGHADKREEYDGLRRLGPMTASGPCRFCGTGQTLPGRTRAAKQLGIGSESLPK